MDILSYLTDLLKTQKEVGIEGLGTFFKKKIPGRYDVEKHLFVPPTHTLNFSAEVRDTSKLISYISETNKISTESAEHQISLYAEEISRQLAVSGRAELYTLGTLTYLDDNLVFTPRENANLGSEFYGLPKVVGMSLEHDKGEPESQGLDNQYIENIPSAEEERHVLRDDQEVYEKIGEPEAIKPQSPEITIETPERLIEEELDKEPEIIAPRDQRNVEDEQTIKVGKAIEESNDADASIWHFDKDRSASEITQPDNIQDKETSTIPAWVKILVILLITLTAIGIAAYFIKPELFVKQSEPVILVTRPADTAVNKPLSQVDTVIATDNNSDSSGLNGTDTIGQAANIKGGVVQQTDSTTTWEIIGASLTKREVDQYIKDMKARGYAAKAVPTMPGKRRVKISIATFYDEESAREGRRVLVKKLNNKDLYIFQNKNIQKPI